jgi:hypothetical protein
MVKKETIDELIAINSRIEKVTFSGKESFKSLKCLNRLAHFAIHGSIFSLQKTHDNPFGPNPVYFLSRFIYNDSFLTSVPESDVEKQEDGFRKVKKRLIEDIKFFTDYAKLSLAQPPVEAKRSYFQMLSEALKADSNKVG